MKDNNGKYYTFKRYKPKDDNDKTFNAGSKPLNDIAYLTSFANVRDGDLVRFTDDELRNEGDGYFAKSDQWFEVVGVTKEGSLKDDEDFKMTVRVVPVDDYGNPWTKAKIGKANPNWLQKFEKYGYVDYFEARKYADEDRTVIPKVLAVSTEDVPNWDYRGTDPKKMTFGRYITDAPEGEEELYDDKDKPTGKFERWPQGGDYEVRKAAFDRQNQADDRAKARADRKRAFEEKFGKLMKDAANPWGNKSWLVDDLKKLYPDADESALKNIVDEAVAIGYGQFGEGSSMDENELEDLCMKAGVEPDVVNAISSSTASSFSRARSNSTRNGYDY